MTKEHILFYLVIIHIVLWRLGGWGMPPLGKGWRRFALPAVTLVLTILAGTVIWWRCIAASLAEVGVNTLPYGDKSALPVKVLTMLAIGVPAVILGMWVAPIVTLAQFGAYYVASKKWNNFWWGFAEIAAGFSQGLCIALAINR